MSPKTEEELFRRMWASLEFCWMLRPHGQTRIADFVKTCRRRGRSISPILVNAHRRLGKSYFPLILAIEEALKRPGTRCLYGAPTQDQVRSIVEPSLMTILSTCPAQLKPKPSGLEWRFRHPSWPSTAQDSTLRLAGVEHLRGDRLRGAYADFVVLDEVREMLYLEYLTQHVIGPQFVGRPDPVLLMLTTPPATMDHPWIQSFLPIAKEKDRYIVIRGSENEDFTEDDETLLLELIGSKDSIAWRREVECELVCDPEELITPEFGEERDKIVIPVEQQKGRWWDIRENNWLTKPSHYVPYVVLDSGYDPDFTAILWCYPDFERGKIRFVDEVFKRRMTLRQIKAAIHSGNIRNWGRRPPHKVRHIADIEKRALRDLADGRDGVYVQAVKKGKYSAEAGLTKLRTMLRQTRIEITSNCVRLIDQLENGIWLRNARGQLTRDFHRTDVNGHWDAGKAAVYASVRLDLKENPFPREKDAFTGEILPRRTDRKSDILARAFGGDRQR